MPLETSGADNDPGDADAAAEFVEVDPSGRYGRYKEVLGKGAFKKVYRAFDELEGIEVAWNQIKVSDFMSNSEELERLYSEVHLLKTLKHKNIIKFYSSWVDTKNEHINFITEIFTSGTLRQYRKKHKHIDLRALKKWARQILEGLYYLHSHDPPVIHRDLKCDNIFINGNQGEVKIGDLGLAAILRQAHSAHSVIGTPEFMAPELYEEEYNELVDIYAFGMCLLELVTFEYPYAECSNAAQIYKKVTSGIKPASLAKVKDPDVRLFIEKCIGKVSDRLSAKQLLVDPFMHCDANNPNHADGNTHNAGKIDNGGTSKDSVPEGTLDFTVHGQMKDLNTIFIKLRIEDSTGHVRNIHFPFDIGVDTPLAVASEMVEELDLTDQDVSAIAEMINVEIRSHIPDWSPKEMSEDSAVSEAPVSVRGPSVVRDDSSPSGKDAGPSGGGLALERLPSGRLYWWDSPKWGGENSPLRPQSSDIAEESCSEDHSQPSGEGGEVGDNLSNSASPKQKEDLTNIENGNYFQVSGSGPHSLECSDDVELILEKLEHLLAEQQKEVDELKKQHRLVVSEMLKQLPPEVRCKVLSFCKLEYKMDNNGNSARPGSISQINLGDIHLAGRSGDLDTANGEHYLRPIFRNKFAAGKGISKSSIGLAVLLGEDMVDYSTDNSSCT